MRAKELREKNEQELRDLLRDELRAHFNLRMQRGVGEGIVPSEFGKTRRNIARIKTVLREKLETAEQ